MRYKTDKADARGLAQIVPLKCGSLCPTNLRNRHHPSRCPLGPEIMVSSCASSRKLNGLLVCVAAWTPVLLALASNQCGQL
jgi:hypothetical protein